MDKNELKALVREVISELYWEEAKKICQPWSMDAQNLDSKGTDIRLYVDMAKYQTGGGYIPVEEKYCPESGYFNTYNDWYEGQPVKILAWMPTPKPYSPESSGF